MKSAFVFVAVLALAGGVFASGCESTPEYSMELKLACDDQEIYFNWPNYENVATFYTCQGQGRPHLMTCSAGTYYSYVLQSCQDCNGYIPSQPCKTLKLSKGSSCQPIKGGSTEPTPIYPPSSTTKGPTTTKDPSGTTTKTTKGPNNTAFPPAPSPSTVDPSIPIPPTAAPTPPPVVAKPPNIIVPTS